jgi:predicted nucleic acid-binding protein
LIYWDTSCVLKLYAAEEDSSAYLDLASGSEGPLISSEVLAVELYYALQQKELRNEIKTGATEPLYRKFQDDVVRARLTLLPFGADVAARAVEAARSCCGRKPPITLRSLDGIHLATTLAAGIREIATTDDRMRSAAGVLGLRVIDPVEEAR